jgi:hypothetical protein
LTSPGRFRRSLRAAATVDEAFLLKEIYDVQDRRAAGPGLLVTGPRVNRLSARYVLYAKDGRRKKIPTTIPEVSAPPRPAWSDSTSALVIQASATVGTLPTSTDDSWPRSPR